LYNKTGVDPQTNAIMHRLGPELRFDNTKSKKLLKMEYTDPQESIIDMMYSMIEHGMVKRTSKFKPPPNPSNKVRCRRIVDPRSSSTII
uniref:Protein kinase domain-containing protein n=1 Tax=Anisakis simplex TaxID=6269 RepID=A0A0M3JBB5_ANISI